MGQSRRQMSTAVLAPERRISPPEVNPSGKQPSKSRIPAQQLACVAILVLADLAVIAASLQIAILLRSHLLPHIVGGPSFQNAPFPFRHYIDLGWLWSLMIVFLAVEGLYTQRRTLWNEIGQLIKAIGLGLVAVLGLLALSQLAPTVSRATILLTGLNLVVFLPVGRYWTKRCMGEAG